MATCKAHLYTRRERLKTFSAFGSFNYCLYYKSNIICWWGENMYSFLVKIANRRLRVRIDLFTLHQGSAMMATVAEVSSGKTGALAEPDLWPLVEGANTKENVVYGSQSSVQWRFLTGSLYTYITLFPSWTKAYLLPCQSVYTVHAISLYDSGVQNCHMCIGDVCVACWRHVCVFLLWVCCQGACGSLQEISPTLRHSL